MPTLLYFIASLDCLQISCGVCISDRTNDAVFVVFDMEMAKLTNLQTEVHIFEYDSYSTISN